MKGRCLCGDVTWAYDAAPTWNALCHCESCRRATSAPVVACLGARRDAFRWTGAAPAAYASSPGAERLFCGRCGSSMAWRGEAFPEEIFLYAACLDDPADYVPDRHTHYGERLSWLSLADDLPKIEGSNREAET
ncbi:MAG: GFA family protein [Pseudomonadota bacterium]